MAPDDLLAVEDVQLGKEIAIETRTTVIYGVVTSKRVGAHGSDIRVVRSDGRQFKIYDGHKVESCDFNPLDETTEFNVGTLSGIYSAIDGSLEQYRISGAWVDANSAGIAEIEESHGQLGEAIGQAIRDRSVPRVATLARHLRDDVLPRQDRYRQGLIRERLTVLSPVIALDNSLPEGAPNRHYSYENALGEDIRPPVARSHVVTVVDENAETINVE